MKIAIVGLSLSLAGCGGSMIDNAVRQANTAREAGLYIHDTIETVCAPAYQTAESKEEYHKVEKLCGPARKAYLSIRVALATEVALLSIAQAKGAKEIDSELQQAINEVLSKSRDLANATRPLGAGGNLP